MPDYDITAPDGRKFRISAPDGASQDQVLAYAKDQFAKMPAKEAPGMASRLATAAVQGLPGGPVAIAGSLGAEGLKLGSEALDKVAYDAGGRVTDMTGSPIAGTLVNTAIQAVPMVIGGGEGAKIASPAFRGAAQDLMQSALKPSIKALKDGSAAKAISTMLDEGINVTKGGVEKLRSKIGELNDQIFEAIKSSPATVDKSKVANELRSTLNRFERQVTPNADTAAIEKAWTEFLEHPLLAGKNEIPVALAQELKQGTYGALKNKYGQLGSADVEAQKTLARGLKEGIAEAVPEVAGLNAQESKLIGALNLTERRAFLEANKNPMGLALLAKNPEAWAAFMADRSGLFKSLMARALNAGQEQIPANAGRGLAGVIEAAKMQQQQGQP
jgi:hypothetical protein